MEPVRVRVLRKHRRKYACHIVSGGTSSVRMNRRIGKMTNEEQEAAGHDAIRRSHACACTYRCRAAGSSTPMSAVECRASRQLRKVRLCANGSRRAWLVYRCFVAKREEQIPLFGEFGLTAQLGSVEYTRPRRFRAMLQQWLSTIHLVWPECPARICSDGRYLAVRPGKAIMQRPGAHHPEFPPLSAGTTTTPISNSNPQGGSDVCA